jgi:hypothetical protein
MRHRGELKMQITTLANLNQAKLDLAENIAALHENNKDLLVYSPNVSGQRAPRNLYVVRDVDRAKKIEKDIEDLTAIKDAISVFYGDSKRRNNLSIPAFEREVAMVRIWVNNAISSRTISIDTIINRLEKYFEIAYRYRMPDKDNNLMAIEKELKYFKASNEQEFILRSAGAQDVIMRIYYENNEESRTRLTAAGMFVAGTEFIPPKIVTPKKDEPNPREGVFANLTQIPYTGAPSAIMYKKSDAELEKLRIGFDQGAVIDKKKKIARKKGAAKVVID